LKTVRELRSGSAHTQLKRDVNEMGPEETGLGMRPDEMGLG
jgi:hypothetical protein